MNRNTEAALFALPAAAKRRGRPPKASKASQLNYILRTTQQPFFRDSLIFRWEAYLNCNWKKQRICRMQWKGGGPHLAAVFLNRYLQRSEIQFLEAPEEGFLVNQSLEESKAPFSLVRGRPNDNKTFKINPCQTGINVQILKFCSRAFLKSFGESHKIIDRFQEAIEIKRVYLRHEHIIFWDGHFFKPKTVFLTKNSVLVESPSHSVTNFDYQITV